MSISSYFTESSEVVIDPKKEAYFSALCTGEKLKETLKSDLDAILYTNNMRQSGLHVAICQKNHETFKELLDFAQEHDVVQNIINLRDYEGKTALVKAAEINDVEFVRALLVHKPDLYLSGYDLNRDAMYFASINNNVEMAKELKDAGMLLNTEGKSPFGFAQPIHFAAYNGAAEMVDFLVKNGVDKNTKNGKGKTALMLALQYAHRNVIKVLLENDIDTTIKDSMGHDTLWYANHYTPSTSVLNRICQLHGAQTAVNVKALKVVTHHKTKKSKKTNQKERS